MKDMKELKIEAPQGYEIDKENSTFECIKFKKKQEIKTWDDLCVASLNSNEVRISGYRTSRSVFLTEKEAKSTRAASMISQLMPYYGGAITDEEWSDISTDKYVITRYKGQSGFDITVLWHQFLAFHTEEQRDSFYKNNEQLVKDYLMLD